MQRVVTRSKPSFDVLEMWILICRSEHINMSIDPYAGRNPSHYFVELTNKEQADRAMLELNGKEFLVLDVR